MYGQASKVQRGPFRVSVRVEKIIRLWDFQSINISFSGDLFSARGYSKGYKFRWQLFDVIQVFHDMANFVRSESIVREELNFCADSDVIEVGQQAQAGALLGRQATKTNAKSTNGNCQCRRSDPGCLTTGRPRCRGATTRGLVGTRTTAAAARRTSSYWRTCTPR